ncbi:hypothetical protein DRH14_02215 [Candidatus Shapirobacteria bacterium]|nr:MAG: hypothetical protein DRH14_02215 [Candidatus Shapirobacteria bacterium]
MLNKKVFIVIFWWFFITRLFLFVLGFLSRYLMDDLTGQRFFEDGLRPTDNMLLDAWVVWDAGWYLDIAENGYSPDSLNCKTDGSGCEANYVFFPLYPVLIKFFGKLLGNNVFAGILFSNMCLFLSTIFLFKLSLFELGEKKSLGVVKYLFLVPVSFIFSGVFSESLFLLLLILCFYFAKTNRFFWTGSFGFLLSLCRFVGVLAFLPLIYMYFKKICFDWKKIGVDFYWLLLIPVGFVLYMYFVYLLTGDFFAHFKITMMWVTGKQLLLPTTHLLRGLFSGNVEEIFNVVYVLFFLLLFLFNFKKLKFEYILLVLLLTLVPLSTGLQSMPRYLLVVFPLYELLARVVNKTYWDELLSVFFALLQGFLFVFWVNGFSIVY